MEIDTCCPNIDEITKVIHNLKNGKCQGTDKIHAEQIKYASSINLLNTILMMITLIWTTCKIPTNWLISHITCLYKNKGSRNDPKNYRGISIMATLSKILTALIIERLQNNYETLLMDSQFGFRSNRSTTDAIFILRCSINASTEGLYCCFIDLKSAYDWINRDMLFNVLTIRFGDNILIKILKALYTNTTAAIKNSKQYFRTYVGSGVDKVAWNPLYFLIFSWILFFVVQKRMF